MTHRGDHQISGAITFPKEFNWQKTAASYKHIINTPHHSVFVLPFLYWFVFLLHLLPLS